MSSQSSLSLSGEPRLIITVDTEEQFDWSAPPCANTNTVNDPGDIDRFQKHCAEFGAAPIYFLSYPLLIDDRWRDYMRALVAKRAASPGLHLHQWATPPATDLMSERDSFQTNLPTDVYRAKLAALADVFEDAFGYRADAHRAGRYGIGPDDYTLLSEAGIEYDFSPTSAFDFRHRGGPNFLTQSNRPFVMTPRAARRVYVTPLCGARSLRRTLYFLPQKNPVDGFVDGELSPLRRQTAAARLSPEGSSLRALKALTRRLLKDETPVLTFTIHSTSLTPGATPYGATQADVDSLLDITRNYLSYFTQEIGGEILSLSQLKTLYADATHEA